MGNTPKAKMKYKVVDGFFKPKRNGYLCGDCHLPYLSVDLEEGTTPAFMSCFRTEGCKGKAVSMGYPKGDPPSDIPLLIEFYRPNEEDMKRIKHPGLLNHIRGGGLVRRATADAPELVKALA